MKEGFGPMSYTPSDYSECPGFLRDYLYYMLTIKGRSKLTVEGYFIDLRTFFRFLKKYKGWFQKRLLWKKSRSRICRSV